MTTADAKNILEGLVHEKKGKPKIVYKFLNHLATDELTPLDLVIESKGSENLRRMLRS